MRWWRRHPLWFWFVTFGLAGLTALVAVQAFGRASAAVERWGRLASVVVVERPVAAGDVLGAADVRVERVPARLVPPDAVEVVDDVAGRTAVVALSPGEMVLRSRLAPDGLSGVAALVPEGMRAVALPVVADGGGGLRVRVGDWVDVLATFDVDDPSAVTVPTVVVAEGASVVDVQPESVTVAVPASAAPRLAYAAARATLTLALTPHPPPHPAFSPAPAAGENAEGAAR